MAKTIATRIKENLKHIICNDQTGHIKSRYIGRNKAKRYDIMHHTDYENIPAILIAIDFEKAFDCLDWSFLHLCLSKFGLSYTIRQNVSNTVFKHKQLCKEQWICLQPLPSQRGVRQGYPLSSYLFIIAVETLAIATGVKWENKRN